MRMPTSKGGGARFRGPTSSHEYNTNEDQKYLDMVELYKQSNLNKQELAEAVDVILSQNAALQNYVNMLEGRMLALENQLESLGGSSWWNGQFYRTSFVDSMDIKFPNSSQDTNTQAARCDIDVEHRLATIPKIHHIPKTHSYGKNGEVVVPNDLKVKTGRTNTGGRIIENDIRNAFNGDNTSYWKREVVYDPTGVTPVPEYEDVQVEISLPLKMVNDLNINTINIHPHPERGVKVENVEIHHNNAWKTIKGFEQEDISTINEDKFSPRKKWYFPNVPVQKIRITMRQYNAMDVEGQKVFVLGAQEIGVFLSVFEPSGGMVLTPFDMRDVGIYNIESIEHVFLNRSTFSYPETHDHQLEGNIFDYQVLIENGGMLAPVSSNNWSSQTAETVWIKTYMNPDPHNGINPCLHAVRLHYTKS